MLSLRDSPSGSQQGHSGSEGRAGSVGRESEEPHMDTLSWRASASNKVRAGRRERSRPSDAGSRSECSSAAGCRQRTRPVLEQGCTRGASDGQAQGAGVQAEIPEDGSPERSQSSCTSTSGTHHSGSSHSAGGLLHAEAGYRTALRAVFLKWTNHLPHCWRLPLRCRLWGCAVQQLQLQEPRSPGGAQPRGCCRNGCPQGADQRARAQHARHGRSAHCSVLCGCWLASLHFACSLLWCVHKRLQQALTLIACVV